MCRPYNLDAYAFIGDPSVSANCMAIDARLPPMSVLPSTRFTVPSGFTAADALDCPPQLNPCPPLRHARATAPLLPQRGAIMRMGCCCLQSLDCPNGWQRPPVRAAVAFRYRIAQPELERVDAKPLRQLVYHAFAGKHYVGSPGARYVDLGRLTTTS